MINFVKRVLSRLRGGGEAVAESVWGLIRELSVMGSMMSTFLLLGRSLGAADYGSYVAIYAIVAPVVTYVGGGVTLTLLQHVVRERESLAATTRACMTMTLGFGVVLVIGGLLLAHAIVEGLSIIAQVAILVTEFLVIPIIQVAASAIQAVRSYVGTAKILSGVAAIKAAIVIVLYALGELTVARYAVAMFVATCCLAAYVMMWISRQFDFRAVPGRAQWALVRTNLAYSIGISGSSLNNEGDKLVLSGYGFRTETGLYGAATRVINLGMVPVTSIVAVTHRRFLENDAERGQHLRRALRFARPAAAYAVVWCAVLLIGAPLLPAVMGADFEGSVEIVRWLAPVVILRAVSTFPLNALMGLGYVVIRSSVIVVNALIALSLYLLVIPDHGWKGAVIATLISEFIEAVVIWSLVVALQRRQDRAIDRAGDALTAD